MVQAHGHVGPEALLDGRRALGRQLQEPAVEVRPEGHALVGHPVSIGEAEHLEPARIGEDRAVPAHERVQSAQRRHDLLTGPEGQVVGVRQEHPRPGGAELVGRHALDRGLGADRHERRRLHRAAARSPRGRARASEPRVDRAWLREPDRRSTTRSS